MRECEIMAVILFLCMLVIPWVMGNGILCILYRKSDEEEFSGCDAMLTGWITVIGAAEMTHLSAVFLHFSLTRCTALFGGLTVLLTILSLAVSIYFIVRKKRHLVKNPFEKSGKPGKLALLFVPAVLLLLSQLLFVLLTGRVYLTGDMTLETVVSFLETDGVYLVNPMTGFAYEGGIPLRLEILCLPTLYSMLCRIFSLDPQAVVRMVMPCVICVYGYGAFYCVGRSLFFESAFESVARRVCFLTAAAVMLWVGSYGFGMDGFGVLYSGWRGVTIRNVVLIPFVISLCLRRKWMLVVLCVAAEACLVWTLYGAGACLFTAVGLAAIRLIWRRMDRPQGKEAAK